MNEDKYYAPIIQAMQNSQARAQQKEQLKAQIEQHKMENTLRQHQLDIETQRSETERDYHKSLATNEHDKTQAMIDAAHIEAVKNVGDFLTQGGHPSAFQKPGINPGGQNPAIMGNPGGTPDDMVDVPGMGQLPISSFATPEDRMKLVKQKAFNEASGNAEGNLPSQLELGKQNFNNAVNLAGVNHTHKLIESAQSGAQAQQLDKIREGYENARTQMQVNGHLMGIKLQNMLDPMGYGEDSDTTNNILQNKFTGILNGQGDYKSLTKKEKPFMDAYAAHQGWILPTDQKAWNQSLDSISGLDHLMDKARELATKYSRDSPGGNFVDNHTDGLLSFTKPGGPLDSEIKSFKSFGGTLASTFDQQKRKSDPEIIRQIVALFDPRATMKDNLAKINDHQEAVNKLVKNTFAGMPGDQINYILGNRGITNFGGFKKPGKTGLQLNDGSGTVEDTPENRKKYGVDPNAGSTSPNN